METWNREQCEQVGKDSGNAKENEYSRSWGRPDMDEPSDKCDVNEMSRRKRKAEITNMPFQGIEGCAEQRR